MFCFIDDVLVFWKDQLEHDLRLEAALNRIQAAGITLNREKCCFNQTEMKFLGYVIDKHGIRPDPEKTAAVQQMNSPTNLIKLHSFMGIISQLAKFIPNLAEMTQPLHSLLSKNNSWI